MLKFTISILSKYSVSKSADILLHGGIIIFPTDTVYGIGCLMKEKAIKRLYKIKNRPLTQPTALLMTKEIFNSSCQNVNYMKLPNEIKKDFLFGKVTLIIHANDFKIKFPQIILHRSKIGIRLPKLRWLKDLINKVGPLVASSANKKGENPPKSFEELDQDLFEKVDLVVESDMKSSGKSSAIYDSESGKYLRN